MKNFETIFGMKDTAVKGTCIIMPLIRKDILELFGVSRLLRGKLYGCGLSRDFTLIHTGMGAPFTADALLYLKGTPCKKVILFGSCGLVEEKDGLSIGSLVSPSRSYSEESFSRMLSGKGLLARYFSAHKGLLEALLRSAAAGRVKAVTCATVSSLKLEEERINLFRRKRIDVLDMECSAFFSAAKYSGFKPIALFYVSDIVKQKPFYCRLSSDQDKAISSAIKNAVNILCQFTRKNSSFLNQ